jgi:hypothetical protein
MFHLQSERQASSSYLGEEIFEALFNEPAEFRESF